VAKIQVPTLVLHGDSDAIVPFDVSGRRVHDTLPDSELVVIEGGPHGFNVTHAEQFNRALLEFLGR
jgi:non-heme chloroperoxidase